MLMMSNPVPPAFQNAKPPALRNAKPPGRLMTGSLGILALLSASCCVLPIGLSILGLGGAWLAMLGPLTSYRVETLTAVGAALAWSWLRLWMRWNCVTKRRSGLFVLGFATMSLAVAASSQLWEDEVVGTLLALWRQT